MVRNFPPPPHPDGQSGGRGLKRRGRSGPVPQIRFGETDWAVCPPTRS